MYIKYFIRVQLLCCFLYIATTESIYIYIFVFKSEVSWILIIREKKRRQIIIQHVHRIR